MVAYLWLFFLLAFSTLAQQTYNCEPFQTTFDSASTVSSIDGPNSFLSPFVGLTPPQTYAISPNEGLILRLSPPQGAVTRHGSVNDQVGIGATVNSTFRIGRGSKVNFELVSPKTPGSVVAAILADANEDSEDKVRRDEIDFELIPGDPKACQTNLFTPTETDSSPHYGVFGRRHHLEKGSTIFESHQYSILLAENRIEWAVDGETVRTLWREDAYIDGVFHWPRHNFVISLGIWDGSSAPGTSHWAKGPISWDLVEEPIVAYVKKVSVECI